LTKEKVDDDEEAAQFKVRVAVEAIRGEKPLSELGSQFKVHPMQIAKWRKSALEQPPELFVDGRTRKARRGEAESDALYEEIGRLKVELDWLKKSWHARLRTCGDCGPVDASQLAQEAAMKVRDLLSKQVFVSLADNESGFNCREQFGKCLSRHRFLSVCREGERESSIIHSPMSIPLAKLPECKVESKRDAARLGI
jgi:hypothetical protein